MADPLYLSLWFPRFSAQEMLPRALSVLRQFPYSTQRPGITYLAVHPVSWNEPTVLEQRFEPGVAPEEAIGAGVPPAQPSEARQNRRAPLACPDEDVKAYVTRKD